MKGITDYYSRRWRVREREGIPWMDSPLTLERKRRRERKKRERASKDIKDRRNSDRIIHYHYLTLWTRTRPATEEFLIGRVYKWLPPWNLLHYRLGYRRGGITFNRGQPRSNFIPCGDRNSRRHRFQTTMSTTKPFARVLLSTIVFINLAETSRDSKEPNFPSFGNRKLRDTWYIERWLLYAILHQFYSKKHSFF